MPKLARKKVIRKRKPAVARVTATAPKKAVRKRTARKKPNASAMRKKLLDILTVPNSLSQQLGEQYICNPSSGSYGQGQIYAAPGVSSTANVAGTLVPNILTQIAYIVNPNQTNLKYELTEQIIDFELSSQSNAPALLIRYTCMARDRIVNTLSYDNPLNILGQGFSNSGINATSTDRTNSGLLKADLTPFQSPDFCQNFKILQTKRFTMMPGKPLHMSLTDKKVYVIHPNTLMNLSNGQTYSTGTLVYSYLKGTKFYVFQIQGVVSDNNGTSIVTTAPKIDCLIKWRYTYKYINDNIVTINSVAEAGIITGTPQVESLYTSNAESYA